VTDKEKDFMLAAAGIGTALLIMHIDRTCGVFRCPSCNHEMVPNFKEYILSPHVFTRRYMKCPECDKNKWFKKDICLGQISDD